MQTYLLVVDVLYPILAWAIAFTVTMFILLSLGFGPTGILAGMGILRSYLLRLDSLF
jgi:hypothetical protein